MCMELLMWDGGRKGVDVCVCLYVCGGGGCWYTLATLWQKHRGNNVASQQMAVHLCNCVIYRSEWRPMVDNEYKCSCAKDVGTTCAQFQMWVCGAEALHFLLCKTLTCTQGPEQINLLEE